MNNNKQLSKKQQVIDMLIDMQKSRNYTSVARTAHNEPHHNSTIIKNHHSWHLQKAACNMDYMLCNGFVRCSCVALKLEFNTKLLFNLALNQVHSSPPRSRCWPWLQYTRMHSGNGWRGRTWYSALQCLWGLWAKVAMTWRHACVTTSHRILCIVITFCSTNSDKLERWGILRPNGIAPSTLTLASNSAYRLCTADAFGKMPLSTGTVTVVITLRNLIALDVRRPASANIMMTSSNGNNFWVTGHLCGEFTGYQWIPSTKASDA